MNLCTNAAHAMEENGGTLTVGARSVILDSETIGDHCELPPGRYLKITVSDTGHGMSQDVIERLFDPFFTTKETGKGTGMGLAVVHNIVKSHKGMIKVNSKIGTGSSFHVFLPETVKNSDHRSDPPTLNVTQRL
jgi:signal transduction histidine kinase